MKRLAPDLAPRRESCPLFKAYSVSSSEDANLVNRRATLIAGVTALIATGATLETGAEFFHRHTDLGQIFAWIINQLHTVGTNRAY